MQKVFLIYDGLHYGNLSFAFVVFVWNELIFMVRCAGY